MNFKEVARQLREAYPSAHIIPTTRRGKRITEAVAELGVSKDRTTSTAVAVIDSAHPHYHKVTTETYKVLRGRLKLYVDDQTVILREGADPFKITPFRVHHAEGDATWVEVKSEPPWSKDDFYAA